MFDLDFSKLAVIGVVALVVIGPEKLPRVARTVGALLGKAQRYVSDVKAEVSRSIELEELKKMQEKMQNAVQEVEGAVQSSVSDFEKDWQTTTGAASDSLASSYSSDGLHVPLSYKHPKKQWRVKQSAMPQWFKAKSGIRRQALSGAARVVRFRPKLK